MAIVQQHGLSTVLHDLVGIASAMELRLEVVESVIPEADSRALRSLMHQLRGLSRTVRLLQGNDGTGALTPAPRIPLSEWWALVAHLTHGVLPRGVAVEARFTNAPMPFAVASALTQIWLLACEALAARLAVGSQVRVVALTGDCSENRIALSASLPSHQMKWSKTASSSRWQREAMRIGEPMSAELEWWNPTAHAASWRCSIPVA